MLQLKSIGLWLRAWLLLPVSVLLMLGLLEVVVQNWQMLHGAAAQAYIHQKLYNGKANRSGISYMIVKYQHAQGQTLYARVQTDSSIENFAVGQQTKVYYVDDPKRAILSTESIYNGKLLAVTLVTLMLMYDGITSNRAWRNRRRDGYLPN
ncbi:hypothetical protein ACFST9_04565 [Hymenobacter monticola]|uniref:DUF3592 domain-containing protein n=1 Tax=Hymenobacter monticola TaxID=1705399 RepID=A0ABY4BA01_9BACT|nr:hypothetical protein [Hymenobacter monticola]UOE35895.1 hypothetical protein MTP16_09690 [Hymenobacter monticola]